MACMLEMQPFHLGLDKHQHVRIDQRQDTLTCPGSFSVYITVHSTSGFHVQLSNQLVGSSNYVDIDVSGVT